MPTLRAAAALVVNLFVLGWIVPEVVDVTIAAFDAPAPLKGAVVYEKPRVARAVQQGLAVYRAQRAPSS